MLQFILIGFIAMQAAPADTAGRYTLDWFHDRVEVFYPEGDEKRLQERLAGLNRRLIDTGRFPQVTAGGMASYQSDVTEVTFAPPGAEGPVFSRDHYRLELELSQTLYDGGRNRALQELESARGIRASYESDVALLKIREQVNELYFSALMLQQQERSLSLLLETLRQQMETMRIRVENETALAGQAALLEAEMIRAEQDSVRLRAEREGTLAVLGILTGSAPESDDVLELPPTVLPPARATAGIRPEYDLFRSSLEVVDRQLAVTRSAALPRLSAFGRAAYGRPGLDAFDDRLQGWAVAGLRVQWNMWDALNLRREVTRAELQRGLIRAEEEKFELRRQGTLQRLDRKMEALREIIRRDEELIRLMREVVDEQSALLGEGTITATEYVTELQRLNSARLNRDRHRVELSSTVTEYLTNERGGLR